MGYNFRVSVLVNVCSGPETMCQVIHREIVFDSRRTVNTEEEHQEEEQQEEV